MLDTARGVLVGTWEITGPVRSLHTSLGCRSPLWHTNFREICPSTQGLLAQALVVDQQLGNYQDFSRNNDLGPARPPEPALWFTQLSR